MGAHRFQDLVAWQLGRSLRREVKRLCQAAGSAADDDYRDQLRRAARSVTSNVAEGFPCSHLEFARFLDISARSVREIEDRLIEGVDERLFSKQEAEHAFSLVRRVSAALARLAVHLRTTPDPPQFKRRPPGSRERR